MLIPLAIHVNLGKPVPECQNIVHSNAARDGGGVNRNPNACKVPV